MAIGRLVTMRDPISWALAFCFAFTMYCCPGPALAQSSIGAATVVKNQVQGVRGSATRALASGGSVFSDDLVKAGDASLAQLLFTDQTTFTVAANSEAVLSRVFRPQQGGAQLIMRAVIGAFRFVSGVQGSRHYRIEFPGGYIAVRGTIIDILVWPTRTVVILDEGAATVHVNATGADYDLTRPGTDLVVNSNGRVDGPMTWDATIMKINGNIPFPLFGTTIWPTQQQFDQFDPIKDLNDMLNAGRGQSSGVVCQGVILSGGYCSQ